MTNVFMGFRPTCVGIALDLPIVHRKYPASFCQFSIYLSVLSYTKNRNFMDNIRSAKRIDLSVIWRCVANFIP